MSSLKIIGFLHFLKFLGPLEKKLHVTVFLDHPVVIPSQTGSPSDFENQQVGWGTRLYPADPGDVSNLSQPGAHACSQCLQAVFDVMHCDEDIIFYHIVKQGQSTEGRVSLISLSPSCGICRRGIRLLFEGSMEEIKNPLSKVHKGSQPRKGSFPPKKLLQISFDVPLNIVTYYDDDLQTGCTRLPYLLLIRRGLADYRPSWVWLALTLHDTLHSSLVEDTPTQRTHTNSHSLLASNSSVLLCLWDI